MKIVINTAVGGFGLSPLAIKRLAELENKPCYFFSYDIDFTLKDPFLPPINHILIQPEDITERNPKYWETYSVPNPNECHQEIFAVSWEKMTLGERQAANAKYQAIEYDPYLVGRDDPRLVQVIEELGAKANGTYAELKVVEIPDDVKWYIRDYDNGTETVEEKHRSWS